MAKGGVGWLRLAAKIPHADLHCLPQARAGTLRDFLGGGDGKVRRPREGLKVITLKPRRGLQPESQNRKKERSAGVKPAG